MKRMISYLLLVALFLNSIPIFAGAEATVSTKDGKLEIEAENIKLLSNFSVIDDKDASGQKGIRTSETCIVRPYNDDKADAMLDFTVDKAGGYFMWLRVKNKEINQSIWYSVNGGKYIPQTLTAVTSQYTYIRVTLIESIEKGQNINIRLKAMFGDVILDSFIITADGKFAPVGVEFEDPYLKAAIAKSVNVGAVDEKLEFEAENIKINSGFSIKVDSAVPSEKVIFTPDTLNDVPTSDMPAESDFAFEAKKQGDYVLWGYVRPNTTNKGIWLSKNFDSYTKASFGGTPEVYQWVKVAAVNAAKPGEKILIRIKSNNGWFTIDRFLILAGKDAVPEAVAAQKKQPLAIAANPKLAGLYPKPPIAPPKEHPRVVFRAKDIDKIKANIEHPENKAAKEKYLKDLAFATDGKIDPPTGAKKLNFNDDILGALESKALDYALNGNEENGKLAVAGLHNYFDTLVLDAPVSDDYVRPGGSVVYVAGEIYDWCYKLLTFEDKARLIGAVEKMAGGFSVGWPPKNRSPVADHPAEAQLLRDLLSFAIAAYDERPDIYDVVAGRLFAEYVEVRKFHYQNGVHHQGKWYGPGRGQWDLAATQLFGNIGYPDIFGKDIEKLTYYLIYLRRPDGDLFSDGDGGGVMFSSNEYLSVYSPRAQLIISSYFKNPYAKYDFLMQNLNRPLSHAQTAVSAVDVLLLNDPEVKPVAFEPLPNSRYFGGPNAMMLARTGWEKGKVAPVVTAQMKIDEWWFGNHDHLDNGTFQLYYKGALAFHNGDYSAYGTAHDYNYQKRTIAHNTVLVYDPSEQFPTLRDIPLTNDGGQRFINGTESVSTFEEMKKQGEYGDIGKVLGHEIGPDPMEPDYSYLKGDITKSYTSKVEEFKRSFMFLDLKNEKNPAAMVVFDRVVSGDPSFKKTWLLHGLEEPTITGNRTVYKDTVAGYSGKLTIDTLLPRKDNITIEKVGGQGNEFFVNGKNYTPVGPVNAGGKITGEKGSWRMELSPKKASKEDYFLNVLQVGDTVPDTEPLETVQIDTEQLAGVQIADRVVVFSKKEDGTGQELQFKVTGSGTYKIAVAGVKSGTWQITCNGNAAGEVSATKEGGLLYFNGEPGDYRLTYKNEQVNVAQVTGTERQPAINIKINDQFLPLATPPIVKDGRVFVPMRSIFEALGSEVEWNDETKSILAKSPAATIKMEIGNDKATIGNTEKVMDSAPFIWEDNTMVPVRFVAESLKGTVEWYDYLNLIDIKYTKPKPKLVIDQTKLDPKAIKVVAANQSGDDGSGNNIENSLDGDLTDRWAVSSLEGEAWGIYDLGDVKNLDKLRIAFYGGDQRIYTFSLEVSADGQNYTRVLDSVKSSGKTVALEDFLLGNVSARYVKFIGHGNSVNQWNSIAEMIFTQK